MARRRRPLVLAGALARATTKAVVGASVELVEEASAGAGRGIVRGLSSLGRRVASGEVGIGPVRVHEQDIDWIRRQVAAGVRTLLLVPDDTADRLRAADPATMARTLLALVGGDEALIPLPSAQDQIRLRFQALLDEDGGGADTLEPALLAITAQLSPDEARILRLLGSSGPAIVVAVESTTRTSRRGPAAARHLSLIVERAGGDHHEFGPSYVDNLVRLGLCTVEEQSSQHHRDVALIEELPSFRTAQAAVRRDGRRPRTIVGRLRLTDLGRLLFEIGLVGSASPVALDEPPPVPVEDHRPVPRVRVERPRPDTRGR